MDAFWTRLHSPSAILMAFIAAFCLAHLAYTGYATYRTSNGQTTAGPRSLWWLIFVVIGLLALIEWIILVFLS